MLFNKRQILLRLEEWSWSSKSQLQSRDSNPHQTCFRPTNARVETGMDPFTTRYLALFDTFQNNILIFAGDMNTHIDRGKNTKFYKHNTPKRSGEYLADIFTRERVGMSKCKILKKAGKTMDIHLPK